MKCREACDHPSPRGAGKRLDKELEKSLRGNLPPANQCSFPPLVSVCLRKHKYTVHRRRECSHHTVLALPEINLSIGGELNLSYEEIIFEFYSSICMTLLPPP